jgi:exopolysaccharide biosynthesis protein
LIILVVDGRQQHSRGVDLEELAGILHDLGVEEAMNLDGGGSSTLVVNKTLINRPTGGTFQREVMSALVTRFLPE